MDNKKQRDYLVKLQKEIESSEREKSRLEGRLQSALDRLTELGISGVEEAEQELERLDQLMESAENKLAKKVSRIRDLLSSGV